jgi:hypothetical protein
MKIIAPLCLLFGTLGLLLNEFLFDWGRPATIVFATINIAGLSLLIALYARTLRARPENTGQE